MPAECERTRFFCSCATSPCEIRTSASAPKPVFTPYTAGASSPRATTLSITPRERVIAALAAGAIATRAPRRATASIASRVSGVSPSVITAWVYAPVRSAVK